MSVPENGVLFISCIEIGKRHWSTQTMNECILIAMLAWFSEDLENLNFWIKFVIGDFFFFLLCLLQNCSIERHLNLKVFKIQNNRVAQLYTVRKYKCFCSVCVSLCVVWMLFLYLGLTMALLHARDVICLLIALKLKHRNANICVPKYIQ